MKIGPPARYFRVKQRAADLAVAGRRKLDCLDANLLEEGARYLNEWRVVVDVYVFFVERGAG
jgi:hypothetical protein